MKPQLILFIIVSITLFYKKNPKWFVIVGLGALGASMPLFYLQRGLYTAQQLVYYSFFFFLVSVIWYIVTIKETK